LEKALLSNISIKLEITPTDAIISQPQQTQQLTEQDQINLEKKQKMCYILKKIEDIIGTYNTKEYTDVIEIARNEYNLITACEYNEKIKKGQKKNKY
jgi:hypothetical protein